jgi:hypothetical protein
MIGHANDEVARLEAGIAYLKDWEWRGAYGVQRVEDKILWATGFLMEYGYAVEQNPPAESPLP